MKAVMHRVNAILLLGLIGCGAQATRSRGRACLRGRHAPEIGRGGVDESYAILWREHARAAALSSPLLAGRIVETLPAWILDASDLSTEPACAPDLVAELHDAIDHQPLAYTRLLVGQVRAVGRVGDTSDVMDDKAAFLMAIADLPDAALTDYQLDADEPGPPPPKSFIRALAVGYLSRSSMSANVRGVGAWLQARLANRDDREELLLRYHLKREVAADTRARLDRAPDPVAVEVVIGRLDSLVAGPDAAAAIIAAHGRVPLATGIPGADRDLFRAALGTKLEPSGGHVFEPPTVRRAFDPWADWLDREPANGKLPATTIALRLGELDRELDHATRADSRCGVVREIAAWASGDARFDALIAPLIAGGQLHASTEAHCRIAAALALDGVSPERRTELLVRLLTEAPLAYDRAGDDDGAGEVRSTEPTVFASIAAHALATHPEWITDALRPALVARATAPLGGPAADDEIHLALEPAFAHLLAGPDGAAIARAWLADLPRIARDTKPTSIYPSEAAATEILALAEAAPGLGLADDARAMFADIAAIPTPDPAMRYTHPTVVRAATIALATMEATSPGRTP